MILVLALMIGSGLLSFGANIASHGVSHSLRSIHPDGGTSRPSQKEFILQDAELPPRTSDTPLPIDAYYTEHAAAGQNIDDLSQLNQTLVASQYLDMRPTSIPATYYTITALKALGPQYLASYADGFEAFFLSRLNESNLHFEETINYSYIAQKGYQGANMVFRVLTPDLIHQMALISLAEMALLSDHFGSAEIDQWVTEIKNTNNTDGGFGTYVHPDSTIHETYFAVKALYALNGFQPPDLSPTMAGDVVGFLENSQYGYVEMLPFLEGSISEYDTSDPYYGWESFDVDLQAFRICEFLGVESPSLTSGFLGFVADNNLFIQEDSQWVHNWNSKFGSGGDAWGTAIIGECIRILDAQAQFETEIDQSTNAITTHYRQTGISEGENWIYTRMNERTEIYSQCLILEYLNRTRLMGEVLSVNEMEGIAQFFGSFIGHDGGCSYVPTDRMSNKGRFHQYLFCESDSLSQAQKDGLYSDIYGLYWEDVLNGGYYFTDHRKDFKLELLDYHHLAFEGLHSTYYGLALLHKFDLFDRLYDDIGLQWLEMEQWLADLRHPGGKFLPHQDYDYHPADLQTTYMALQSLQWLFAYNEGQTFSEYFTQAQLDGTADYIYSWLGEGSGSELLFRQDHLNEYAGTYYGIRALEILSQAGCSAASVDYEALSEQCIAILSADWVTLDPREKTDFLRLTAHLGLGENPDARPVYHEFLPAISSSGGANITSQAECPYLDYDILGFIHRARDSRYREVYVDMPDRQIPGQTYDYGVAVASPISLIDGDSIEGLRIVGDESEFDGWFGSWWLSGKVVPEYNGSAPDPFVWGPTLEFSIGLRSYRAPLQVRFDGLGEADMIVLDHPEVFEVSVSVEACGEVLDCLSPSAAVYAEGEGASSGPIEDFDSGDIAAVAHDPGEGMNFCLSIGKAMLTIPDTDRFRVQMNFTDDLIGPLSEDFTFNYMQFLEAKAADGGNSGDGSDRSSTDQDDGEPGGLGGYTMGADTKFGIALLSCTAVPGVSIMMVIRKKKQKARGDIPPKL